MRVSLRCTGLGPRRCFTFGGFVGEIGTVLRAYRSTEASSAFDLVEADTARTTSWP
jgi:hypothetical protein